MEYRVGIVGSRDFDNFDFLEKKVLELLPKQEECDIIIVSGGARGTDTLAERFADKYGYRKEIHRAKWHLQGYCAGYLRNHHIVRNSDLVIAFWNGISKGTRHTINLARRNAKMVKIIRVDSLMKSEND